jgi:hypothetical protein
MSVTGGRAALKQRLDSEGTCRMATYRRVFPDEKWSVARGQGHLMDRTCSLQYVQVECVVGGNHGGRRCGTTSLLLPDRLYHNSNAVYL